MEPQKQSDQMQASMHKIKMMITKKGGCNDIFAAFCQLQYLIKRLLKQNQNNQKQQKQVKKSYQNQIGSFQSHISNKQKILQEQNRSLRAELSKMQDKYLQNSVKSIDLQTKAIQSKYQKNFQQDPVYKLLREQTEMLKKQVNAKNEVIRKLKNDNSYSSSYKNAQVMDTGKKLKGFDFDKYG